MKEGSSLTGQLSFFFFFFFPSCSAPTGVPQHRQEGRSLSRGSSAGASRRAQAERATLQRTIRKWFGPCLTKQSPERLFATYITFFFSPPFLVPSNNPALCHISGNIHTLSLPSPPLIKTWEQTTSFWSGRLCSRATFEVEKKAKKSRRRRREKKKISVTSLLIRGMHPCLPALCNSTWHFYYAWNWYNLLSPLGAFI